MTFNEKYKNNTILLKTFEFAKNIVVYAELLESKRKFVVANQVLKSGTSIGANVKEAQTPKVKQILYINLKLQ